MKRNRAFRQLYKRWRLVLLLTLYVMGTGGHVTGQATAGWQRLSGESCADYQIRLHNDPAQPHPGKLWAMHWCTAGPECDRVVTINGRTQLKHQSRAMRPYFKGPFPNPQGHGCIPGKVWQ